MEDSDFARVSVSRSPDKSNGQKNDEQYQNTNFSSFWKKKERLRHSSFFLCGYVDYNQILKNAGRFEKAQRK